jgi:Flp pilus assembly protein TadD
MSIGNRQKAREFLESAAAIAPAYPENLLNLAESYLTWDDRAKAGKNLAALDALWPQAQKTLSGQAWEDSWDDWSKRRDALRQSLKRP